MDTLRTNRSTNTKHAVFGFQNTPQCDAVDKNTEEKAIHYFEPPTEGNDFLINPYAFHSI